MPWGLHRYYGSGDLHFITCSCYHRQPLLGTAQRRDLFLKVLEHVRRRYQFVVVGYVVMPEKHIWQPRFYDFNVWTARKRVEKLRYLHRNPVKRGLVTAPELWRWSSYRAYAFAEPGPVRVNEWQVLKLKLRTPAA